MMSVQKHRTLNCRNPPVTVHMSSYDIVRLTLVRDQSGRTIDENPGIPEYYHGVVFDEEIKLKIAFVTGRIKNEKRRGILREIVRTEKKNK